MRKTTILLAIYALTLGSASYCQTITTCVGNGAAYSDPSDPTACPPDGGLANATPLDMPGFVRTDVAGNIFVGIAVDPNWHCHHIKKISASGVITAFAGNGDYQTHGGDGGPATAAAISGSNGFCLDNAGNMYIMEHGGTSFNHGSRIRKVSTSGIISTIAGGDTTTYTGDGGPASAATFDGMDIAIDATGNIYFSDMSNQRIRKINTSGIISTIAGTGNTGYSGDSGPATAAELDFPEYIAADATGNVYFIDQPSGGSTIRKISTSGIISTVATIPFLSSLTPGGLACDNLGNVYLSQDNVVRKINSSGIVTIVAGMLKEGGYNGDGIPATNATLNTPAGMSVDAAGNLFIADEYNFRIRKVTPHTSGVEEINCNTNTLRIWPEPNNGTFNLYIPNEETGPAEVIITNSIGQKVKELNSTTNRGINIQLDVPQGLYFVTANMGNKRLSSKMLIK